MKLFTVVATVAIATALFAIVRPIPAARAQTSTTGAVRGVVKDARSGEALAGVAVVASSPSLLAAQSTMTDESGVYKIDNLPPGTYIITFYYMALTVNRVGVRVGVQKTTPVYQSLDTEAASAEVVQIESLAPAIDPTSTTQGITIDGSYVRNIPLLGRTFEAALGAAAGSQGDALGTGFSGSTSLENQYIVDGLNTTGLKYGTAGNPVLNNFIEEIEVITGGYNAEHGRATGGVVNVVTRSGSNEIEGEVFATVVPGLLVADRDRTPSRVSPIEAEPNVGYGIDFGFDLGGPIVKDRLWYFVGVAPALSRTDVTRRVERRTDCRVVRNDGSVSDCDPRPIAEGGNADGNADVDPATGFYRTDPIEARTLYSRSARYNLFAKINAAASPEHQGNLSLFGSPYSGRSAGVFGRLQSSSVDYFGYTVDGALKWTSMFHDNRTAVEGLVGWHRNAFQQDSIDDSLNSEPFQVLSLGDLGVWTQFGGETEPVVIGCTDNVASDPYRLIPNCPDEGGPGYRVGGPGAIIDDSEDRRVAQLSVTQRTKVFGSHEIKAGLDIEDNVAVTARRLSGGAALSNRVGTQVEVQRWVQLASEDGEEPRFDNICRDQKAKLQFACDYLEGTEGYPGTRIVGNTLNWSAYLRDSWQILPNVTINAGLRYEEQRLRYADSLRGEIDSLTGRELGTNAMVLRGLVAPRVGLVYDWSKEGRSKLFGHWGRFYESIPMDINSRSFGGEVLFRQVFNAGAGQCGESDPKIGGPNGNGCIANPLAVASIDEVLFGSSGVLVAPGIQAQYLDELLFGVEYELLDDLKIGIAYQSRSLGRVIEDISTDGAQTYIIANPGEWSDDEEAKLVSRIDDTDDPMEKARLEKELALYRGIEKFDRPRRDYGALQLTLSRRFSRHLYLQGSYTFSRTSGNYPGLISYDNGQVDPNISSQYDLIELLANRDGPMPQDRPHSIKLDGYYTFDLRRQGALTIGSRFRAASGTPIDVLGPHFRYGAGESFLLPRGRFGRSGFDHGLDLRVSYARPLPHGMSVEGFIDLFNVYNRQGRANVDETYVVAVDDNSVNPIVGGTYEDLIFAKALKGDGSEPDLPKNPRRNPNFGNVVGGYEPFMVRLGVRVAF